MDVQKTTRSKNPVEKLGQVDAVPYKKVMGIETAITNAVLEKMQSMEVEYPSLSIHPWKLNTHTSSAEEKDMDWT